MKTIIYTVLASVVFVALFIPVLKLFGFIDWSWWLVVAPILVVVISFTLVILFMVSITNIQ